MTTRKFAFEINRPLKNTIKNNQRNSFHRELDNKSSKTKHKEPKKNLWRERSFENRHQKLIFHMIYLYSLSEFHCSKKKSYCKKSQIITLYPNFIAAKKRVSIVKKSWIILLVSVRIIPIFFLLNRGRKIETLTPC